MTCTTPETHEIIRQNLHRSPLYGGEKTIEGTGPRYCPSIEDKVVRFSTRSVTSFSSSPWGGIPRRCICRHELVASRGSAACHDENRQGPGERAGDAQRLPIEYDCVNPLELYPRWNLKKYRIYTAPAVQRPSGYEEAAAQGLIAGINAAPEVRRTALYAGPEHFLYRTLLDDLVTKGTREPYRIMTSRSEYRLLLRRTTRTSG